MKNCGDDNLHSDTTHDEATLESVFDRAMHFVLRWEGCLLYTSPSPRDRTRSRMPSSA